MPGREGFLALYLLLLSFSISGGLLEGGGRASERRMRSMERGVELDLLSAFFGILFLLTISFLPFLPFCRIGIRGTALLFLYSASLSSLLLLLSSFLRTERGAEGNAALLSLRGMLQRTFAPSSPPECPGLSPASGAFPPRSLRAEGRRPPSYSPESSLPFPGISRKMPPYRRKQ